MGKLIFNTTSRNTVIGKEPEKHRLLGTTFNRYDHLINEAALKRNISPMDLKILIEKESGFRPQAIGKAGEIGLGQFMYGTYGKVDISREAKELHGQDKGSDMASQIRQKIIEKLKAGKDPRLDPGKSIAQMATMYAKKMGQYPGPYASEKAYLAYKLGTILYDVDKNKWVDWAKKPDVTPLQIIDKYKEHARTEKAKALVRELESSRLQFRDQRLNDNRYEPLTFQKNINAGPSGKSATIAVFKGERTGRQVFMDRASGKIGESIEALKQAAPAKPKK